MDAWVTIDARTIGKITENVTRQDPCYAAANKLGFGLAGETVSPEFITDSPEYIKAVGNNLIVAIAGREAQRRHDPKSIRKHALREDEEQIASRLESVTPQTERGAPSPLGGG